MKKQTHPMHFCGANTWRLWTLRDETVFVVIIDGKNDICDTAKVFADDIHEID